MKNVSVWHVSRQPLLLENEANMDVDFGII